MDSSGHRTPDDPRGKKHIFMINPRSFNTKTEMESVAYDIRSAFSSINYSDYVICISRYPRDAVCTVHEIVKENENGMNRVYAVGGDGILFECLNGIIGVSNTELAAIPYGKENDFVRAFGEGKIKQFRNIVQLMSAPSISTDIIQCGSNYALNFCTVGLESLSIMKMNEIKRQFARFRGFLVRINKSIYTLGGLVSALNKEVRNQSYTIIVDGEDISSQYATINIANGPCYGGDKCAAVSAMPNDGVLDLILGRGTDFFSVARVIPQYLKGKYSKFPKILSYHRIHEITVASEMPVMVDLDGETFFETSITVRLIPNAIQFVSPCGSYEQRAEFHDDPYPVMPGKEES
jgi:YegS/Rv2252/BmrU family lipid kinase